LPFGFPVLAFRRNGHYEWHGSGWPRARHRTWRAALIGCSRLPHAHDDRANEKKPRRSGAFFLAGKWPNVGD